MKQYCLSVLILFASLSAFGAASPHTSYFENISVATNVIGRAGAFTNDVSAANLIWYGLESLDDVQSQLAKLEAGSNTVLNIGLIGDSWFTGTNIVSPIRSTLQQLYGDAGAGWVGVIDTAHVHVPMDVTRVVAGTWTNHFSGFSIAGAGLEEADSGVVGDRIDWTTTANNFVLHYKQKSGGGTLAYSMDDGPWTNVNTSVGTTVGICGVTNAATASHKFSVITTNAGTTGITLYGVDIQRTNPGVRVHALGVVGRSAIDRAVKPISTTYYQPGLSNLNLNLMVINYGNNDKAGNTDPGLFSAFQQTNVTQCRTVLTNCDVMLIGTPDTGPTNTFTMADYRDANERVARTNRVAFVDAYMSFGPIINGVARGMYSGGDNRHLSIEGGKAFAALIVRAIIFSRIQQSVQVSRPAADLPLTARAGDWGYCTDCLTPNGVGAWTRYEGTQWVIPPWGCAAKGTEREHFLDCLAKGLVFNGTIETAKMGDVGGITDYPGSTPFTTGTGANSGTIALRQTADNSVIRISPGTTTTGVGARVGPPLQRSFESCLVAARVNVFALPNGTDNYWLSFGVHNGLGAYPVYGNFFLYDPFGANGTTWTNTSASNNWLCVSISNSVQTVTTTAVVVATSAFNRLALYLPKATFDAVYLIDGTAVATNTLNSPAATSISAPSVTINKTLGTTDQFEYTDWEYCIRRLATAKAFWP